MAISIHGESSSALAGVPTWGYDENAFMNQIPIVGNVGVNQYRSIGESVSGTAATPAPFQALVNQGLPSILLMVQTVPGAALASFTTRASLSGTFANTCNFGTQVNGTINGGLLNVLGRTLKIKAWGTLGVTGTPNYTIDVALGTNILGTTGVCAMTAATSPMPWTVELLATVTTVGASGVIVSCGQFFWAGASAAATKTYAMANSTPGTGLSVDLTAAYAFTLNATSSASDPANTLKCYGTTVELLG